ncbi:MAG: hypothetical protein WAT74_13825 [Flavobacteriales bacterium]
MRTLLALPALLMLASCAQPTNESATQPETNATERPVVEAALQCDPIVGEFRDLMADYEKGLEDMVAASKVDAARQAEWSERAKELNERIAARGEQELGLKCWQEFHTISQTSAPRIAELGMKLTMLQMEGKGIDPAMLEQMKKATGQ